MINLSQFLNQEVNILYRDGARRSNVVVLQKNHPDYPYLIDGKTYTLNGRFYVDRESLYDIVSITSSIKPQMTQKLYSAKLTYNVFVLASNPDEVREIVNSNVGEIVDEDNSAVEFISSISTLDSLTKNYPLENYLRPYTTDGLATLSSYQWMKLKEAQNNLTPEEKDKIISKLSPELINSLLSK
jgi:hypothetical protein